MNLKAVTRALWGWEGHLLYLCKQGEKPFLYLIFLLGLGVHPLTPMDWASAHGHRRGSEGTLACMAQ